jgi:hypothetical protein
LGGVFQGNLAEGWPTLLRGCTHRLDDARSREPGAACYKQRQFALRFGCSLKEASVKHFGQRIASIDRCFG